MPVTNLHMNPIASRITVGVVIIESPNFQWHEVSLSKAIRDAIIEAMPLGTGVGDVSIEINSNCLRLRED